VFKTTMTGRVLERWT